jgi:hypothetical protein
MTKTTDTTEFKAYPPEKKGMVLGDLDDSMNVINVVVKLPAKLHKKLQKDYYCEEMTNEVRIAGRLPSGGLWLTNDPPGGQIRIFPVYYPFDIDNEVLKWKVIKIYKKQ